MRINQNILAENAQRNLQITNNKLAVSLERLSSGLRINRASDDAAGLAISEKLRAQVSGLGVSTDNANDGISLIRTAEGSLDRVNAILGRMRDLVGWAANGDKTDADRQKYQDEINQLTTEMDRISTTTEYNTKKLLNGNIGTKVTLQNADTETDVEAIGASGTVGATGTYQVSVSTAGQENVTVLGLGTLGLGTTATIAVTTSLASALGDTTIGTYTKTINVSQGDGKTAQVTLTITTGTTGDTIETTLNELNTAFTNAGMKAQATFDSQTSEIKLTSTEVGTKYNLTWIESNSNPLAKLFSGADELTGVTFGAITTSSTLSAALNLADAVDTVTFGFTLANNTAVQYATFATVAINALVTALNTTFNEYTATDGLAVTVSFDDATDKLAFSYGAGSTKVLDYAVTAGAVTIGTLGTELYTFAPAADKTAISSLNVTVLVTDPVGSTGRTVTSTSRYFASGTGGPDVNVDASGISGVTFTLTNDAATTTGTDFAFDLSKGSLTLQIGPNAGTGHRMEITVNDMGTGALGVTNLDVTTQAQAQSIIDNQTIDNAIESVVTERGKLGSYENRLNHTIQNLGVAKENLTSAESRLRDADIAKEMMEFTRNQIMLQAGTAMLAQANTVPQTVLQLLR